MSIALRMCRTPGCNAVANLQCPTCLKVAIQSSHFCSQDCFKSSWKMHKQLAKGENGNKISDTYNSWPTNNYTGKLWPYKKEQRREVPDSIARPDYALHSVGIPLSEQAVKGSGQIKILDDEEVEGMRVACKLRREILDEAANTCDVGVTTSEIDRMVHKACIKRDCFPSPLNYYQFPASCCTYVNEIICHGIPDTRPLQDGDICNVDVTVYHKYHNNFHEDLNETFSVNNVKPEIKKLVEVTYECLSKAIDIVKPGENYREIDNIIQKHAQAHGFSVVRCYYGRGIYRLFHTAPNVPHYAKNKAVDITKPGHCFTIEPIISQGTWKDETA